VHTTVKRRRTVGGIRDCDHALSRRIVDSVQPGTVIVVENLANIRTRAKQRGRESRRRLHSWSFAQLRAFLTYKAEAKGCKIEGVDPRHTSPGLLSLRTYPSLQSPFSITIRMPGLWVRLECRPERLSQHRPEVPCQQWHDCRWRAAVNRPIVPARFGGLGASRLLWRPVVDDGRVGVWFRNRYAVFP